MFARFIDALFGCRHKNYSFPMTIKSGRGRGIASRNGPHVVCFDCSKELPYDWAKMRVATRTPTVSTAMSKPSVERAAA